MKDERLNFCAETFLNSHVNLQMFLIDKCIGSNRIYRIGFQFGLVCDVQCNARTQTHTYCAIQCVIDLCTAANKHRIAHARWNQWVFVGAAAFNPIK